MSYHRSDKEFNNVDSSQVRVSDCSNSNSSCVTDIYQEPVEVNQTSLRSYVNGIQAEGAALAANSSIACSVIPA
jgi:hypothetical protein